MAAQYRKAYIPVTLDVNKEGAILPPVTSMMEAFETAYKKRRTKAPKHSG